jgi:hypothetical protein
MARFDRKNAQVGLARLRKVQVLPSKAKLSLTEFRLGPRIEFAMEPTCKNVFGDSETALDRGQIKEFLLELGNIDVGCF